MSRCRFIVAASALAVLASCSDQPTEPAVTHKASFNVITENTQRHLVAFKNKNVSGDFAAAVAALGGKVDASLDAIGGVVVSGLSNEAVASLTKRRDVLAIEAETMIPFRTRSTEPFELPQAEAQSISAPNTAILYGLQWNMRAIGAQHAWAAGKVGSANVKVAILDTGLDVQSLDATGLIDPASTSFVAADDHWVKTLFPGRPLVSDLNGHGTNVASQVSSIAFATAGVTSKTKLLGVKVCSHALEGCPTASVLTGFLYAIENGADVINMSLGGGFLKNHGGGPLVALLNRVFQVAEQNGVTVVVAAGNDAIDMDHITNVHMTYCDQTHVICVSATGPLDETKLIGIDDPAWFTNFGRSRIDVAAPGGNYAFDDKGNLKTAAFVYSLCSRSSADLVKDEKTQKVTALVAGACSRNLLVAGQIGTSQASPHVAGLAALLVAEHGRNPALIRDIITSTADDLGQSGTDPFYGRGRVNVKRALGL
jgi:subtilisin family serine protease